MTLSCPKDLSVGHLNIYHLANKVTYVNVFVHQTFYTFLVCLNLGLPLTSVTRWLAFQIIQSYEGTRMNLGMQGSRCMFIILFRISLRGAMIWFKAFKVLLSFWPLGSRKRSYIRTRHSLWTSTWVLLIYNYHTLYIYKINKCSNTLKQSCYKYVRLRRKN